MISLLPTELWLAIFLNLSQDALKALSLTSRGFRTLTLPSLVSDFTFQPYGVYGNHHYVTSWESFPQPEVDRSLQRLAFWASDAISPLVRSCVLEIRKHVVHRSPTPKHLLRDALFGSLGRFSALQRFRAHHIEFTQAALSAMSSLRLVDLTLLWCDFAKGEDVDDSSITLNVSEFSFHGDSKAQSRWIALLRTDNLRSLALDSPSMEDDIPSFPYVETLSVAINATQLPEIIPFLSKFPGVQTLTMPPLYSQSTPLKPLDPAHIDLRGIFPSLNSFVGPAGALSLFTPLSTIESIKVLECPTPQDLLASLQLCLPAEHISSFEASFSDLTTCQLAELFALLPGLRKLRLRIAKYRHHSSESEAASFIIRMTKEFIAPPGLTHLALTWDSRDDTPGLSEKELRSTLSFLKTRCPDIRVVWLDGRLFFLSWRRGEEERVASSLGKFSISRMNALFIGVQSSPIGCVGILSKFGGFHEPRGGLEEDTELNQEKKNTVVRRL
ncbi:hypothetical protein FB45DRAFT_121217 [Roridomyces roridus]|uniref:F-box domain-containing protein n=1 Tax=Roridomyces roridus TaxID=1738132 RepID=A0AAD7FG06_9AGAR|nr:hypothetical protein FB45DRAFT_121217 [Roridomyces roridus]